MGIRWTAFPLHPETPSEGRTLEDLFAGRPINIDEMLAHMKNVAEGLGLPRNWANGQSHWAKAMNFIMQSSGPILPMDEILVIYQL